MDDPIPTEHLVSVYLDISPLGTGTRKSWTVIQGLNKNIDKRKLLRVLKKKFNCNGCVITNPIGQVIKLQSVQKDKIRKFLQDNNLTEDNSH